MWHIFCPYTENEYLGPSPDKGVLPWHSNDTLTLQIETRKIIRVNDFEWDNISQTVPNLVTST